MAGYLRSVGLEKEDVQRVAGDEDDRDDITRDVEIREWVDPLRINMVQGDQQDEENNEYEKPKGYFLSAENQPDAENHDQKNLSGIIPENGGNAIHNEHFNMRELRHLHYDGAGALLLKLAAIPARDIRTSCEMEAIFGNSPLNPLFPAKHPTKRGFF